MTTPADAADPAAATVKTPAATPEASSATPSADEIRAAVEADFTARLKAITGVESLEALEAANKQAEVDKLKAQGEFQKLAETAQAEAAMYRARFESAQVRGAILGAATQAMDADVVLALLGPSATVAEDGSVSVAGKPAAAAVAELLKAKPHLARPAGGQGSGAGASGTGATEPPKRADFPSEIDYHRAVAKHRAAQEG